MINPWRIPELPLMTLIAMAAAEDNYKNDIVEMAAIWQNTSSKK